MKNQYLKTTLTPEERSFCALVAKGYSYTRAYRLAFPAKSHLKYNTVRTRAWELVRKSDINTEVSEQKEYLAKIAAKGLNRIDEIIESGKEHNALDASKFAVEQYLGKAIQKTEVIGQHVMVTYDLSGGHAPPIPQDILDQLGS